jgi:acetate kinase
MCNKQSGLLGISGISNDMRNLLEHVKDGSQQAKLAVDIFCYRIQKYIGAYTAVLGRLDAVVFTGGIGENNPSLRAQICAEQSQIGIEIDASRNEPKSSDDRLISTTASRVKVYVIPTDEEAAIAGDTYELAVANS